MGCVHLHLVHDNRRTWTRNQNIENKQEVKHKNKKSAKQILEERCKDGDPKVGLHAEPSEKFNYYFFYLIEEDDHNCPPCKLWNYYSVTIYKEKTFKCHMLSPASASSLSWPFASRRLRKATREE